MTVYTDPFGGSTVQPADVAYRAAALATDVTLVWPPQSTTLTDYVARIMDVVASAPGLSITLPDATAESTGFDVLFTNRGANTYMVKDNAGNVITTVAAGLVRLVYLTANSTPGGTWQVVLFGASASAPDAASLAGLGLSVAGSLLQTSEPVASISVNTVLTLSARAQVYVWTGGVGTLTLPMSGAVGVGADFFFEVRNQGTGVLTLQPSGGEMIDAASNIALQIAESAIVHSNGGGQWYTVGRGRNQQFSFTLLTKSISTGTVTLTTTEAANVVQKYTGVLVGNVNVVLPSVVQVYYVSNQTSGAFTVTFKTAGVGTVVTVPSGQNAVLFCDGLNVLNNSTTVSGLTSLLLNAGAVTTPSIGYNGDSTTGIYQPISGSVAITASGVERFRVNAAGAQADRFAPTSAVVPALGMYGSADLRFAVGSALQLQVTGSGVSVPGTLGVTGAATLTSSLAVGTTLGVTGAATLGSTLGVTGAATFGSTVVATGAASAAAFAPTSAVVPALGMYGSADLRFAVGSALQLQVTGSGVSVPGTLSVTGLTTLGAVAFTGAVSGVTDLTTTGNTILGNASTDTLNVGNGGIVKDNLGRTGFGGSPQFNTEVIGSSTTIVGMRTTANNTYCAFRILNDLNSSVRSLDFNYSGSAYASQLLTNGPFGEQGSVATTGAFPLVLGSNNSAGLVITSDQRVYGLSLHNNAGAITGTANQYIASRTDTGTGATAIANCSALNVLRLHTIRVGNEVHVAGIISFTITSAATPTSFRIALPIASNLAATTDLAGSGTASTDYLAVAISADTVNDQAVFTWVSVNSGAASVRFNFMYEVL